MSPLGTQFLYNFRKITRNGHRTGKMHEFDTNLFIYNIYHYHYCVPAPSWKTCRRSDPNMNTCLQTAMGEAVLSLKDGELLIP